MRFLAAVIAVPVLLIGWQLWSDHSFEQRLEPIAAGISGPPRHGGLPELLGRPDRCPGPRGRGVLRCVGSARRRSCSSRGRPASACARSRATATTASSTASQRSTGRLPTRCRSTPSATRMPARRSTPCSSWHTRATTRPASPTRPPPTASRSRRWPGRRSSSERPPARPSCSPGRWRRSSRRQGGEYGTAECHAGGKFDLHPETPAFPTEHPIVPPLGHGGVPSLVGRA